MEKTHILIEITTRAHPVKVAEELSVVAPMTSNNTPPSPKIAPKPLATALNAKLIFGVKSGGLRAPKKVIQADPSGPDSVENRLVCMES